MPGSNYHCLSNVPTIINYVGVNISLSNLLGYLHHNIIIQFHLFHEQQEVKKAKYKLLDIGQYNIFGLVYKGT